MLTRLVTTLKAIKERKFYLNLAFFMFLKSTVLQHTWIFEGHVLLQIHCNKINASRSFSIIHYIHLLLTPSCDSDFISTLLCGLHTSSWTLKYSILFIILRNKREREPHTSSQVVLERFQSFCFHLKTWEHVLHKILKCKIHFFCNGECVIRKLSFYGFTWQSCEKLSCREEETCDLLNSLTLHFRLRLKYLCVKMFLGN